MTKEPLRDRPFLCFPADGRTFAGASGGIARISFWDATYNILVLGGTGSGKTESVMRPALAQLLDHGCPGIVLDVKGDYASMARRYPGRAVVIGTGPGARPINLLAGMSDDRFRQFAASLSESKHAVSTTNGAYYAQMGIDAVTTIFLFIRHGLHREPTLADLGHYLTRPREFCAMVLEWENRFEDVHPELEAQLEQERNNVFGILGVGASDGIVVEDPSRRAEQWAWSTNYVRSVLGPFSRDRRLRKMFSPPEVSVESGLDITKLIYRQMKTLVLDCPQAQYGGCAVLVSRLLRMQFADAVRTSSEPMRRRLGFGRDRFTFMLCDEFQEHIACDASALASSDADWFATSRSYGHINVVATQGLSMMLAKGSKDSVEGVVQNCRSKIFLSLEDEPSLALAERLAFAQHEAVRKCLLYPERLGKGFVYIKHSSFENGGTSATRFDTAKDSPYAFMRRFIGLDMTELEEREAPSNKEPARPKRDAARIRAVDRARK